jgi:hypothetical protein
MGWPDISCRAADVGRIASQLSPVGKAELSLLAVRQHPIFKQDDIIISGCSNLS